MFLIDEYTPKDIDDVLFHEDIYKLLKNMSTDKSIPHIIFHGPPGSGKKTMVNIFLSMVFNKKIYDMYDVDYEVTGSSSKTKIETLRRSDYHIVIKPKNTNYDRYLLQEVVKKYAKTLEFMDNDTDKTFRVIQINNLDDFTYYAQTSLRRTMENYSNKCRFVMWCNSLSKIIRPIQSRCICIRLPALSEIDTLKYVCDILAHEKKKLSLRHVNDIIDTSKGHTKNALWALNMKLLDMDTRSDYDGVIDILVNQMIRKQIDAIHSIRNKIFNLYITTIPFEKIMEDLIDKLVNHPSIDGKTATQIIVEVAGVEHCLMRCRRAIISFDKIVITIMRVIHRNNMADKKN